MVSIAQVWQGGSILVVVEDPAGTRAVNMRNHERPPILSSMAGALSALHGHQAGKLGLLRSTYCSVADWWPCASREGEGV